MQRSMEKHPLVSCADFIFSCLGGNSLHSKRNQMFDSKEIPEKNHVGRVFSFESKECYKTQILRDLNSGIFSN